MLDDVAETVDEYIQGCPADVQPILEEIRRRVHRAVPDGQETISYQIPTVRVKGRFLLSFAAWKQHVALYPIPATHGELAEELAPYQAAKGTLRFPLRQPIPYDLIERVAAALLEQR